MATLKRRTVLALTAGVWAMGIVSASALAYALNRPLEVRTVPTELAPARDVEPPASEVVPATQLTPSVPATLSIPTITIVSKAPRRHTPANAVSEPMPDMSPEMSTESYPDISKMNCAEWRELDMGHGRVKICD